MEKKSLSHRHLLPDSAWAVLIVAFLPVSAFAATCESLARLRLETTTITSAQIVEAGTFTLPSDSPRSDPSFFTAFETLRAFCRVQGIIRPATDSHIGFEVWLPESAWNGKYVGAGNGGLGGSINYYRLGEVVNAGYVGSSTDTGHTVSDHLWLEDKVKVVDFDYRAVYETASKTKAIIAAFYGTTTARSYFNSCSTGGRQGLIEAHKFPADYDGILAGAPALTIGDAKVVEDLKAFMARGGKLILYHGSEDDPIGTVNYYRRVIGRMGQTQTSDFVRLYVVPGMGHCGGGSGPDPTELGQRITPRADAQHSVWMALEEWVENGSRPGAIIATNYATEDDPSSGVVRTRPVCPYPMEARWTGNGSVEEAAGYVCDGVPVSK